MQIFFWPASNQSDKGNSSHQDNNDEEDPSQGNRKERDNSNAPAEIASLPTTVPELQNLLRDRTAKLQDLENDKKELLTTVESLASDAVCKMEYIKILKRDKGMLEDQIEEIKKKHTASLADLSAVETEKRKDISNENEELKKELMRYDAQYKNLLFQAKLPALRLKLPEGVYVKNGQNRLIYSVSKKVLREGRKVIKIPVLVRRPSIEDYEIVETEVTIDLNDGDPKFTFSDNDGIGISVDESCPKRFTPYLKLSSESDPKADKEKCIDHWINFDKVEEDEDTHVLIKKGEIDEYKKQLLNLQNEKKQLEEQNEKNEKLEQEIEYRKEEIKQQQQQPFQFVISREAALKGMPINIKVDKLNDVLWIYPGAETGAVIYSSITGTPFRIAVARDIGVSADTLNNGWSGTWNNLSFTIPPNSRFGAFIEAMSTTDSSRQYFRLVSTHASQSQTAMNPNSQTINQSQNSMQQYSVPQSSYINNRTQNTLQSSTSQGNSFMYPVVQVPYILTMTGGFAIDSRGNRYEISPGVQDGAIVTSTDGRTHGVVEIGSTGSVDPNHWAHFSQAK